jgi:hypothetical protein
LKENFHQFKLKNHKEKEMVHFRKVLLAVAAVASFIGAGSTANAQQSNPFVCNTSFSPLVVRVEGLRELVGDIVITCTGGNPVTAVTTTTPPVNVAGIPGSAAAVTLTGAPSLNVPLINISVTVAGTRITNRIFSDTNLTDALLFIDEPTNFATGATRGNQNPCYATGGIGIAGVCTGMSYFFENGRATGAGYPTSATPSGTTSVGSPLNVFQGQYGIGGGFAPNEQTVTFVGVPVVQPGLDQFGQTQGLSRIFRIKNIRVQVANSFQINGQIQAFISIQNPPANLVLNNAQGVVGFVQRGLFFDTVSGPAYAQCLGLNFDASSGAFFGSSSTGLLPLNTGVLRFAEAYGVAFKRRGFGSANLDRFDAVYNQYFVGDGLTTGGQSNPTVNYNNESGFYNRSFNTTNGMNAAGIASTGTRLRARFSGIPAAVRLYVSVAPITARNFTYIGNVSNGTGAPNVAVGQGTDAPGSAIGLAGADSNGLVEGLPGASSFYRTHAFAIQGSTAPGFAAAGAAYSGFAGLSRTTALTVASDGTATYTWEVLRAEDNIIDRLDFLVQAAFLPTTTIVTDASTNAIARVSGNFAPIATTGGNGFPYVPSFVLSQPLDEKTIFQITNCATNLLYPYVTSVTGFNTGIAVANTSSDPFGTINETGICRVNYYGVVDNGSVNAPVAVFSKAVPSGQVAAFNLRFGGPDWGVQPVNGFTGYVIIQCNFRWAHGFAFVSDSGNLFTAHGYLALILDPPGLGRATGAVNAEALDN